MAPPQVAFDPNPTIGPIEIGVLISAALFGVLSVQTYNYFRIFPNDHKGIKALVIFVWFCELGQAISVSHTLFVLTVTYYGNPLALVHPPMSLSVAILFSGFIGPSVQAFFANRIRVISQSWYIPIACWLLSFLRFIGSVVAFVEGIRMHDLASYEAQWQWLLTAVLTVGVVNDVIIAVTLCCYLVGQRSRAYSSTVKIIDKLIAWTVQTGMLTSATGLVMLVCFLKMKDNMIWLSFFMFLARFFSISLLASLNARKKLRSLTSPVVYSSSEPRGENMSFANPMLTTTEGTTLNSARLTVLESNPDTRTRKSGIESRVHERSNP